MVSLVYGLSIPDVPKSSSMAFWRVSLLWSRRRLSETQLWLKTKRSESPPPGRPLFMSVTFSYVQGALNGWVAALYV